MHAKDSNPLAGAGIPVREEALSPPPADGLSRRTALKLFSATAMLAMGAGCTRKPERKIVSVAEQPEYQKPGIPLHYASTWTDGRWPYGIMVKAVDGRPVKIEGLPGHPLNGGRSDAWMQASLLSLYDPERLRHPVVEGEEGTWDAADEKVAAALQSASSTLVLTRSTLGPSERALVQRFCQVAKGAQHLVWESVHDRAQRAANRAVYGADGIPMPDLTEARVILSIGSDFLGTEGETLGAARDFAAGRVVDGDAKAESLSRLYVAESAMTATGSNADHRFPLKPSQVPAFTAALLRALGVEGAAGQIAIEKLVDEKVFAALVADLKANRGHAVVLAGGHLPPALHAAVAMLNDALGAPDRTLRWNPEPPTLPVDDPKAIAEALASKPDVVLLLGVNPMHDFPGDFAASLANAKLAVGHGLTKNETLAACGVAFPSAHNLECWNDRAPLPGVTSVCQPLIAPLYDGRQEAESLLTWAKALAPGDAQWRDASDWHAFVKARWQDEVLGGGSEEAWEEALRKGFVGEAKSSSYPGKIAAAAARAAALAAPTAKEDGFELVLLPDPTVFDGRFAGNAWLQELPDPVSRLVWDNAAQISPATAAGLGVDEGDLVTVKVGERTLDLPAIVQTGTAPGTVVVTLGLGRESGAGVGDGVGANAAALLGAGDAPYLAMNVTVTKAGGTHPLVRTQTAFGQNDGVNEDPRPIALSGTKDEYVHDNAFVGNRVHVPDLHRQLHPEWDYSKGPKWEMAIDLSACTGCGACTIACQAENNIPVVGKEECGNGRDMAWIRIDRYEAGNPANPEVIQQPMLCQHCDNAPCENVCPVNATVHAPEGLNEQIYNRCVGTRYCANNCPYKVRRFNYFAYIKNSIQDAKQELMYNPQVTVRMRGVMEKCTFCVQRINAAKFAAANAGEDIANIADGAVVPACQQACPANAIVFGNRNDEKSRIAAKRSSPLGYRVLEELNVRPNVTYLARVRNPAPGTTESVAPAGHADDEPEGGHR